PHLDQARLGASAPYRQRKLLYHNRGDGTFDEVAAGMAPLLMEDRVSRGVALGDLDGDGRLDLVVNDLDGSPQILRNELAAPGNWLRVRARGGAGNTDALGAVIAARAAGRAQTRLVRSGTSYISQDDMAQHFGLAGAAKVERVEVRWPAGTKTALGELPAHR